MSKHIVIAGTGRAGTTALVQLLGACGLDTHLSKLDYFDEARAGLETNLAAHTAPQVVKSPLYSESLGDLISWGYDPRRIRAIIVPVRDLDDAAASRLQRFQADGLEAKGGLIYRRRPSRQGDVLARSVHKLLVTAARHDIPVVLVEFPGFVTNADMAWAALQPVLADRVTVEDFVHFHSMVMRPDYVSLQPRYGPVALARLDVRWAVLTAATHFRRRADQVKRAIAAKLSMARRV